MSKTISAGRTPKILIEKIGGDLSLVGWEGDDILIKCDDDEEMRLKHESTSIVKMMFLCVFQNSLLFPFNILRVTLPFAV